jgi:hypothetical protein
MLGEISSERSVLVRDPERESMLWTLRLRSKDNNSETDFRATGGNFVERNRLV